MSLADRTAAAFASGGVLATRWPHWEPRPEQAAFAVAIAHTIERGGALLAEAPTGVGKSLAYLAPAVLHALEGDARVVIATCTRSLQDQLFERDLPALLETLGAPRLRCARLKGKQNYVCPRALEMEEGAAADEVEMIDALRRWAASDPEGDLDRFATGDPEGLRRMRARVGTDPTACSLLTCRRGRECFWVRARREASEAQVLVVNHALLALSGETQGLLPEFDVLIVDEAHRLEGVLLAQLERSVSRNRFEELFRLLVGARAATRRPRPTGHARPGGLLARVGAYLVPLLARRTTGEDPASSLAHLESRVDEAREDVARLFQAIEPPAPDEGLYAARRRYRSSAELFGANLEPLERTLQDCSEFARGLQRLGEVTGEAGTGAASAELSSECEQVSARFSALGFDLERLADASERDWVYWRTRSGNAAELHGAPISAGDHARRLVLGRARASVLTSATLSSGGDMAFLAGRLGMGESWGLPYEVVSVPSPFPLERQMQVFTCDMRGDEAETVSEVVASLAALGPHNQLVLFTSHERLRRARSILLGRLPAGSALLAQEWDGPAGLLSERFRAQRGAILLGVQSLWEGVDFPGEALEILVVAKLPFSVPDDPQVESRAERLRDDGLDPFRDDALPEAVLRFRQGVGRLIRRADDRGVLVVCDPRLRTASYRRAFLAALPVAPRAVRDGASLADAVRRFFANEHLQVKEDV
jgi:DNA polymerase-3 subunit epsilon/ATP-dependent DNA helicase DinG